MNKEEIGKAEEEEIQEEKAAEAIENGSEEEKENNEETDDPAKEAEGAPQDSEEKKEKKDERKDKPVQKKMIIRIGGKDVDGSLPVKRALKGISGVGPMLANAVTKVSDGLGEKKVGDLDDTELKKIEDIITNPEKYNIPSWLFNRRFDPEDGNDRHVSSAKLELRHKMDINELKKGKSYKGIRHISNLPVRGQRTKGSFRKSTAVGVSRVKNKPGATKGSKK